MIESEVLTSVCSRCFSFWSILKKDALGDYKRRFQENVCWDCEPEGW